MRLNPSPVTPQLVRITACHALQRALTAQPYERLVSAKRLLGVRIRVWGWGN